MLGTARHVAAERAVRKGALWRDGTRGSHSADGSRFTERMLTTTESLRAQGRSVFGFVEQEIRIPLTGERRPSLLPPTAGGRGHALVARSA